IENGYLFADARAGSSSPQQSLIEDIIDFQDVWIKVVVQFNEGAFSMSVLGEDSQISRTAGFSQIPDHSSGGGIGIREGGDASGNSGTAPFTGQIHKFSTYSRVLTNSEIQKY
ncbi:MAG: hypothetical protein NXH75_15215, partial [Halobacteriovoraceae bacterium]|nr:hypothetical protein [Halobacteriovoraceae bacterium]